MYVLKNIYYYYYLIVFYFVQRFCQVAITQPQMWKKKQIKPLWPHLENQGGAVWRWSMRRRKGRSWRGSAGSHVIGEHSCHSSGRWGANGMLPWTKWERRNATTPRPHLRWARTNRRSPEATDSQSKFSVLFSGASLPGADLLNAVQSNERSGDGRRYAEITWAWTQRGRRSQDGRWDSG